MKIVSNSKLANTLAALLLSLAGVTTACLSSESEDSPNDETETQEVTAQPRILFTSPVASATGVWIFEIAQGLTLSSGLKVSLTGGAVAKNVAWQVSGAVEVGTTAHLEGSAKPHGDSER